MARPVVTFENRATKSYLVAYNLTQFLSWLFVFEVFHAALGLVRSAPLTAFMQWAGRTHVLLAIIAQLQEVQTHYSVFITFTAWSITEIIRYPQYGLSGLGLCPKWLTWLRYTAFVVLYPAGIYGEMLAMFISLEPIRQYRLYAKIFDKLSFQYDTFVTGLLIVYPLLFLVLYKHMFKQRSTKLTTKRRPAVRRARRDSSQADRD